MPDATCIPDERLRPLLLGELSDEDAAPLESHLLECPQCVARTRTLRSSDTLVAALQNAGSPDLSAAASNSINQLVQRLSDRSQLTTQPSSLDATTAFGGAQFTVVTQLMSRLEPAASPDELGRLGSFRILKMLGYGGMGAVFLAEDMQLRRHVALKLLRPDLIDDSEAVERFMREARAAAAVRHDNVVTIFQVGRVNGVPFLAQELLEGETLDARLQREEKLPIGDTLRIGREIAAGLAAAHAKGLLHRDIKPSNIWLESSTPTRSVSEGAASRAKLLDFGLARIQSDDVELTKSGVIVGTPAFMSPEQAQGKAIDIRSDLFSLGCVLYRMVTGRLPFQGTDTLSMLHSLAVDEPPPARKLNPQVPSELSDFIAKLLHKDPLQRPWSAENVASRLAPIASSWERRQIRQSSSTELSAIGRLATSAALRKPSRLGIALAAAAAAIVCGAIIITITRPDGSKTKIEVDGDAKLDIAIDNSKPKAAADDATDQPNKVTVNNGSLPVKQPPISIAKPIYEIDFSTSDPNWLTPVPGGTSTIRDGYFVMQSNGSHTWLRASRSVPMLDEADFEVLGRAKSGMWGINVVNVNDRAKGITLAFDKQGQVYARRCEIPPGTTAFNSFPLPVSQLPIKPRRDGEFNVLRVAWRDRSLEVWLNGEAACEAIKLDQSLGSARVGFVAVPDPDSTSFDCEFDSLRIWRAGEGPHAPAPSVPLQAVYDKDFSKIDPNWTYTAETKFRGGRLHLKSTFDGPWVTRTEPTLPVLESADVEVVGQATSGFFGCNLQGHINGLMVALDSAGQLRVWQSETLSDGHSVLHDVGDFGAKPLHSWKAGDSANTLRVSFRDGIANVWVNGEPACDAITVKRPLGPFRVSIAGVKGEEPFNCQFDALRIWHAGEAPPVPPVAAPGKKDEANAQPPPVLEPNSDRAAAKPVYENDFSDLSRFKQPAAFKATANELKNGQLIIQLPTSTYRGLCVSWPMTSADFEIVGRATKGLWGFNIAKPLTQKNPEIKYWQQVLLDHQGKLKTGVIDLDQGLTDLSLTVNPVVQKSVATWKGDGAFNTLRGTVRDGLVRVWINGDEACEPIKLPDQFPPFLQIWLAAIATDDQGVYAEFDSVRVWRASEGPPLPEKATPPKDNTE